MFGGVTDIKQIADNADNLIQIITQIKEMSQVQDGEGQDHNLDGVEGQHTFSENVMQEQQSPSKEMKNLISPISTGHSIFEEGKGGAQKNLNRGTDNKEWW